MYRYLTRNVHGQTCLCAQRTIPSIHQPFIFGNVNIGMQQKRNYRGHKKRTKKDKDLYEILELSKQASNVQIKGAYFRLSKKYHPDINKSEDAAEKFAEISEAYGVLGKPHSRKRYDRGMFEEEDIRNTGHPDRSHAYRKGFRKYDGPPVRGRTSIFDFDEWNKNHYSELIAKKAGERKKYDDYNADIGKQKVKHKPVSGNKETGLLVATMFVVVIAVIYILDPKISNFRTRSENDTFHERELAKIKKAAMSQEATSQDLETNLATD
ncbi:uncharacterized protein [Argopecten irradians]|uniref:uncharacterized protein n=1 Tax=Argopecten irradians TaxID=31199 RepID=UPI003713C481